MRTIRVTGKGNIKVHPDMTRITVTLTGRDFDYGETLKRSAEDTEQMKAILEPFGFASADLKTLSFDVEPRYESIKVKNEYKRQFDGYEFTHVLKVEFESDNKRLGKILYALANCRLHPEFRLSYTVRDSEAVKNELLGKAVQDAMAKAEILSKAAGVKLGDIQNVDYSWGEINFEYRAMSRGMAMDECTMPMENSCYDMDIEPDDIDVQDTVTVVWEIGQEERL